MVLNHLRTCCWAHYAPLPLALEYCPCCSFWSAWERERQPKAPALPSSVAAQLDWAAVLDGPCHLR